MFLHVEPQHIMQTCYIELEVELEQWVGCAYINNQFQLIADITVCAYKEIVFGKMLKICLETREFLQILKSLKRQLSNEC